jgi:hypothetical protein
MLLIHREGDLGIDLNLGGFKFPKVKFLLGEGHPKGDIYERFDRLEVQNAFYHFIL